MQQPQPTPAHRSPRLDPRTADQRFGEAVAVMRLAKSLTQRALAERLTDHGMPVDASAVSRIEKGSRSVRLSEALTIAQALDVSLNFLIGGSLTVEQEFGQYRNDTNAAIGEARKSLGTLVEELDFLLDYVAEHPHVLRVLKADSDEGEEPPTDVASYVARMESRLRDFAPTGYARTAERRAQIQGILGALCSSVPEVYREEGSADGLDQEAP